MSLDLDSIARRVARAQQPKEIKVSVLTDEEKLRLQKEEDSTELNGSGGGLGLGAVLEGIRDAAIISQRRRAAVRASKCNDRSEQRIAAARAEKAKKKKMKKRGR